MSKYDLLRDHLMRQSAHAVTMGMDEISRMVPVPASALRYKAWWANKDVDRTTHSQCKSWGQPDMKPNPT
jgi:hypothetical protein